MSRVVEFEGPTSAKIYVVGEAPGEQEVLQGRPFVGGAGKILDKLLMDSGIIRKECRIGNVMRVRPAGNNFRNFYLDKQYRKPSPELEEGRRYLIEDIKRVRPNVVLALGNEPLNALLNVRGISEWRGSILWSKAANCKVVPTLHPAFLMRQWSTLALALFDVKRATEEAASPIYNIPKRNFLLAPTFSQVMEELSRLQRCKRIAFDIETVIGEKGIPLITCISFADTPSSAICVPFTYSKGVDTIDYWPTVVEEMAVWEKIRDLLEDGGVEKVAQNAPYDITVLRVNPPSIRVQGLVMDTMCAHHTMYPELPKGLGTLCSLYTRQPYYKHWSSAGNDEVFWEYNCMDSAVTLECAGVLEEELRDFGIAKFYKEFVHPLIPIVIDMQLRGVRVDEVVRQEAVVEYQKMFDTAVAALRAATGREVNILSPKQLCEFLYEDMGLPKRYKKGTTNLTVDEDALDALSRAHPSPLFDAVLSGRSAHKTLGTYLANMVGHDGRVRCSYLIGGDRDGEGGTKIGRLSSRKSIFGTGTNLQNIPKGVCRRVFLADEGKSLVEVDLAQADARVVAYLAEDFSMIGIIESEEDLHQLIADSLPKGFTPRGNEYLNEKNPRRLFAKKHVHAFNYGEGPVLFAQLANVTVAEGRYIRQTYFDRFPAIKRWQLSIQTQLGKSRIMVNPLGRKRIFYARWGDALFREAYAYIPASTVADCLNLALIRFVGGRPEDKVLLQNHDAFAFQTTQERLAGAVEYLAGCFDIPLSIKGRILRIPTKVKVGKNWDELEEVK